MTNMIKKRNQNAYGQHRSRGRLVAAVIVVFVDSLASLSAQNPPAAAPDLARVQKVYAERCVGCHGADFRGTDQGPGL